jgi:ABC-type bacteriocin/lantibiotic exporter with double-glycine peptidase domain
MRRSVWYQIFCLLICGVLCSAGEAGVWLDVPFVAQEKNACGAACIAMITQYWERMHGAPVAADAKQIRSQLYSSQAHGIYASDMEDYLKRHGFRTFAFRGEWNDLKEQLEKGRPLVVALSSGRRDRHYVVVVGLDWNRNMVLKNDPAERKLLKQGRADFEKAWQAAGNWVLLALPQRPN